MKEQRQVTWKELDTRTFGLARELAQAKSPKFVKARKGHAVIELYGIPTGGSVIAAMVAGHLRDMGREVDILETPIPGAWILDDICDSGSTLKPYKNYRTAVVHCRTKSLAIPTIHIEAVDEWIIYPYEHQVAGSEIVTRMIQLIGDDPTREGLIDTPARVLKAWEEVFVGYRGIEPKVTTFDSEGADQLITLRDIEFVSFCEHHILPFFGKAHVGYIPNGKILGLSKLARLVEYKSRRLQVQERLTEEIAKAIEETVAPKGVAVVLEAVHFCMIARGVKKAGQTMGTSVMRGVFRDKVEARDEFLTLIGRTK